MLKVKLHYRDYIYSLDKWGVEDMDLELDALPAVGHHIILEEYHGVWKQAYYVDKVISITATTKGRVSREYAAHIFATRDRLGFQESERMGVDRRSEGYPRHLAFEGKTVADLMEFFGYYPLDMKVATFDNATFGVDPQGDVLVLSIDEDPNRD